MRMKIEKITVLGLFGNQRELTYEFNPDLNIITGRNGSGKTTLLKLAWFIISGNIIHALKEVSFRVCVVKTDLYSCTVIRTSVNSCKVIYQNHITGEFQQFDDDASDNPFEDNESAEDKVKPLLQSQGGSIFFPTFRRIEGGFSLPSETRPRSAGWVGLANNDVDDVLSSVSRGLSEKDHVFVAAISTQDINGLLLRRYAAFSDIVAQHQEAVTRNVIAKIKDYQSTKKSHETAEDILSDTRVEIEKIEDFRRDTMRPLDAVRLLAEKLFRHSGISFGTRLSFGDAAAAVSSDKLSSGEKQMLSFICYNAFYKNSVIFIDEPELSLHVDWQRQLYPILQRQGSSNQFIFATHSPFIYGKYPDKELAISSDRGGE